MHCEVLEAVAVAVPNMELPDSLLLQGIDEKKRTKMMTMKLTLYLDAVEKPKDCLIAIYTAGSFHKDRLRD